MAGKRTSIVEDVTERLVCIRRRLLEIYDRAMSEPLGLDDVDTEVVCDQLDIAIERTELAILEVHPELRELDPAQAADEFERLEARHASERTRPKDDAREDLEFVTMFIALSAVGLMQIVNGWRVRPAAVAIAEEMDIVLEVMGFIGYILHPDELDPSDDDLDADERIYRASRLEQYELLRDETRGHARARLRC